MSQMFPSNGWYRQDLPPAYFPFSPTGQNGYRPVWFTTKCAGRLVRLRVAFRLLPLVCVELVGPVFDLLAGFRFRYAIAFLDFASQYRDIAFDLLDVVVREFAPLVVYGSTQLLPIALNPVPSR